MKEWVNWSGLLRFTPQKFLMPKSEEQLATLVRNAFENGQTLKIAAAGHSSSSLVETNELLVNLNELKGIVNSDDHNAVLRTGMTVHEANMELQKRNLALFNTGDVDVQTLAGAIS